MLFAWFFFIFVSCHIGPRWSNGWSNGVRRSFLIRILFLLNISWRTASIKNLFWLRYFLCSLSLLCIDLRIAVVIHVFFKRMRKPSFLKIYAQQNLKGCVAWALLSESADWVGCYAKYLTFKDTSWADILHVEAEFHSTVLHGRRVFPT